MKATLVEAWERMYADGKAFTLGVVFDVDGEPKMHGVRINRGDNDDGARTAAVTILHTWITEVVGPGGEVVYPPGGIRGNIVVRDPWPSRTPA